MLFDNADNIFEFFKGSFPIYALVPILVLFSLSPVISAHEFNVYRMQHYDLHGTPHGCRNALLNVEARPLQATGLSRKCVVARLADVTPGLFSQLLQQGAAGLLAILPQDLDNLSPEEHKRILQIEGYLLEEEVPIPVYLATSSPEVEEVYRSIQELPASSSAAHDLVRSVVASGYQLVVSSGQPSAMSDLQIPNIQGKLTGFGIEENLPTLAIVAHYDAFGLAPLVSYGADSNGSGVVALLELARLLSQLYTSSRTHPRVNVLFLLSGGGKFNFQGAKKWIEDNLDIAESSLLADSVYTLCLDSLGSGDNLYLHVSKPPREGSPGHVFFQELQAAGSRHNVSVNMVHKKINLADESRVWEHERFSMRRLPAFTLSHLASHRAQSRRSSILDTRVDQEVLQRNIQVVGEALARHMYNLTEEPAAVDLLSGSLAIQKESVEGWAQLLSSLPRPAQTLNLKHPLVVSLHDALARYLKDVRLVPNNVDKREPEVVFYQPLQAPMNAYKVKPAVFDLVLALAIAAYLGVIYLLVTNFYRLEGLMRQTLASPAKAKMF